LLIRLRDRQVGRKLEEFLTENVYLVTQSGLSGDSITKSAEM